MVRRLNAQLILQLVREQPGQSLSSLTRRSGLRQSDLAPILTDLKAFGLLTEGPVGGVDGAGGEEGLYFNPKAMKVIGLTLGPSKLQAALTDLETDVLTRWSGPLDAASGRQRRWEVILEQAAEAVESLLAAAQLNPDQITGLGVSLPGQMDVSRGISHVIHTLNGWRDVPVVPWLEDRLGIRTFLEHNVRAMALGEWRFGSARGTQNFLAVKLGTGIDAAVMVDGRLVRGASGHAGELGHVNVVPSGGPSCTCGSTGCLDAMSSGHAVARRARERLRTGAASLLTDSDFNPGGEVTAQAVHRAAVAGDELAASVLAEAGWYLGLALASAVNLLNPERIVIGGGLANAWDYLAPQVHAAIESKSLRLSRDSVTIVPATLGPDAPARGAAAVVVDRFFGVGEAFGFEAAIWETLVPGMAGGRAQRRSKGRGGGGSKA